MCSVGTSVQIKVQMFYKRFRNNVIGNYLRQLLAISLYKIKETQVTPFKELT